MPALEYVPEPSRNLGVLRRLLRLLAPHRTRFWVASAALILGAGVALSYPRAAGYAIDLGIAGREGGVLNRIVLVLVAAVTVHALLVWIRHYLMSWLGERVVADLRVKVFDRILALSLPWFHERRTGELVGRLASDVSVIEGVVGTQLSVALRNAVQLIGGFVLLFVVDWWLALVMVAVIPPLSVGGVFFGRAIRRMSRAVQDRLADASGRVQESIGAIATVQSFVREEQESAQYAQEVEGAFAQAVSLARWRATFLSTVSTGSYVAIAIILWLGGHQIIDGAMSPGDLTSFVLYTAMVAAALGEMAGLWGALQRAAGATERLVAIIDTEPDIRDCADPVALPNGRGAIVFESVAFSYPSRPEDKVIVDFSLTIKAGQSVALVGSSGAGKSTIVALLQRYYDTDAGRVLFESVDVRRLRLAELRGAMAVVAQEPVLFSGSIRDNILYGKPGASPQEIESAAADAFAHDFISGFLEGYDTRVGERGVKLSGGQKQRIAIARAILANPRVLILDEATSNLDAESESLVQKALAKLMHNRTTLIVAHRLSTVRDADHIVVLEGGVIVEQGVHEQLIRTQGAYRRLVEHQVLFAAEP